MEETATTLSQTDTLTALTSQDYAAQQSEMMAVQQFDWFSQKMLPTLLQAGAIVAVVAAGVLGWEFALVAGAGMLGFELTRAHFHNIADLNRELVLYHNEIAHAVGKAPSEKLTMQDMRHAADENIVGDQVVKPLKMELEHLAYRSRYHFMMALIRAVVTTAGAIAMQSTMSGLKAIVDQHSVTALMDIKKLSASGYNIFMSVASSVGLVGAATIGIEGFGKSWFDKYEPPSVYHELTELQKITKKQALKPEQVFNVIIKTDHELAGEIQERLGKPYTELSYRNKIRVMKACENMAHAQALTEAINNDALPITAVTMSAFHQMDWTKTEPVSINDDVTAAPPQQAPILSEKSFVAALVSKRQGLAQATPEPYHG